MAKKRNGSATDNEEIDADDLAERLTRSTVTGDLRNLLLDELKHHQKNPLPWNMRSEGEQHETVNRVTGVAEAAVRKMVRLIAADGRRTIIGTLEQFTAKDGIKATITFPGDDATMLALNHVRGTSILVVVADDEPYVGESEPVDINPDEPQMFDDGDQDGGVAQPVA